MAQHELIDPSILNIPDIDTSQDVCYERNPGPIDPCILTAQRIHRSQHVWDGKTPGQLDVRRGDHSVRDGVVVHSRMIPYLIRCGFYGVHRLGRIFFDHALITALVERWRPETNTVHFPVGEATVTLQDVEVLFGLPINGRALVWPHSVTLSNDDWRELCFRLLGKVPPDIEVGATIKITWLVSSFNSLPEPADEVTVQQYSRAYILMLIGSLLFVDTSTSRVKLYFLLFLQDLDHVSSYSWGGGVLAILYRWLSLAALGDEPQRHIAGPVLLFQLWAWEHIRTITPRLLERRVGVDVEGAPGPPLGARYGDYYFEKDCIVGNVLPFYRWKFDTMVDDDFIWMPYDLMNLPDYCTSGSEIWLSRCPVVGHVFIGWHLPDRVLRQFGLRQEIPLECVTEWKLNPVYGERGLGGIDWFKRLSPFIDGWNRRHDTLVHAYPSFDVMELDDPYRAWFYGITRRTIEHHSRVYMSPFQSKHTLDMVSGIQRAIQRLSTYDSHDEIRNDLTGLMIRIGFGDHLHFSHMSHSGNASMIDEEISRPQFREKHAQRRAPPRQRVPIRAGRRRKMIVEIGS